MVIRHNHLPASPVADSLTDQQRCTCTALQSCQSVMLPQFLVSLKTEESVPLQHFGFCDEKDKERKSPSIATSNTVFKGKGLSVVRAWTWNTCNINSTVTFRAVVDYMPLKQKKNHGSNCLWINFVLSEYL